MPEPMGLDDILNEKPAEQPKEAPEAEKTEPAEAPERNSSLRDQHREKERLARERDPATGKFKSEAKEEKAEPKEAKVEAKTEEPAKAEPKPDQKEDLTPREKAFLRAAEEERRKRQELERRMSEPKKETPEGEKKGFWDDPEGVLQAHQHQVREIVTRERLAMSEQLARSVHTDFDEKMDVFEELIKENPALRHQMMASPNPGEFAYRAGKAHKEFKEVGNLDELRSRIEKETRVKVEAEIREKMEKEKEARKRVADDLPNSLSNVSGTSPGSRPTWSGPTPLDNILAK